MITTSVKVVDVFFIATAFITLVLTIAVTASPSARYFGPRAALAGWHAALTAVCFPLVVSEQRSDPRHPTTAFADRLDLLVLAVQLVNVVALVVNGPGIGQQDNTVVKPSDETYGYSIMTDVSFLMLWVGTFVTAGIAFVVPAWDAWANQPPSHSK